MRPAVTVIEGGKERARPTLERLYETCGPAVRSRCRYLLKDEAEAEDAMHEVFARALQGLESFRSESSPVTWLVQIATHHCLNVMRSRNAAWREETKRIARLAPVVDGGGGPLEGRDLVRALLSQFDEETQRAAIHYHVDEMTLEEVAEALGRSVPTVRKRLSKFAERARAEAARLGLAETEETHG